jgi:hypothetical protein
MGKDTSNQSLSDGIHERMPQFSCTAQAVGATADELLKVQLSLTELETTKETETSMLFKMPDSGGFLKIENDLSILR